MKKFVISSFKIVGVILSLAIIFSFSSKPALAEDKSQAPERWRASTGNTCEWINTSYIKCDSVGNTDNGWEYYFDPKNTVAAGHLVFQAVHYKEVATQSNTTTPAATTTTTPSNRTGTATTQEEINGIIKKYGYLHFYSNKTFNDATLTISPTDPTRGTGVRGVTNDTVPLTGKPKPTARYGPDGAEPCALTYNNINCRLAFSYGNPTASSQGVTQEQMNGIAALYLQMIQNAEIEASCNNGNAPLPFIFCPILNGITEAIGGLIGGDSTTSSVRKGLLISILQLPPLNTTGGDLLTLIVSRVILVANSLYIIIFLLLIFGSSIPFMQMDSYTIKKTLPKFIGAVILTQFAIPICSTIVDFFNILGLAIPNLLFALLNNTAGFQGPDAIAGTAANVVSSTSSAIVGGAFLTGVAAAAIQAGWFIIILFALAALIAAAIAVVYMLIRYFILFALVILSPLAFASWVLPGTEKFFKQWWTNFIRLNAMFVTIMALLSGAIVMSRVLANIPSVGGSGFIASIIPLIALLLVPKTLKWTTQGMDAISAGALNAVSGLAGKGGKAAGGAITGGAKEAKNAAGAYLEGKNNRIIKGFGRGMQSGTSRINTAAARKAQADRIQSSADDMALKGSQMSHKEYVDKLLVAATGGRNDLSNGSTERMIAAVRELAKLGKAEEVRKVYESGALSHTELMQGIGQFTGDMKEAIPDVIKDAKDPKDSGKVFAELSPEAISKIDMSTVNTITANINKGNYTPQQVANIRSSAKAATADPDIARTLNQEMKDALDAI